LLALFLAAMVANAAMANAEAGEKRKLRPQLTQQVLSAAHKNSLDMALLKFRAQLRLNRPAAGKY
jgi:hypothetical protein